MASDHDVFECRHRTKKANVLERSGDSGSSDEVDRSGRVGFAIEQKLSAIGYVKSRDDVEEGCFPGPIGTDQSDNVSSWHGQINVAECLQAAEAFGHPANVKQQVGHVACL